MLLHLPVTVASKTGELGVLLVISSLVLAAERDLKKIKLARK